MRGSPPRPSPVLPHVPRTVKFIMLRCWELYNKTRNMQHAGQPSEQQSRERDPTHLFTGIGITARVRHSSISPLFILLFTPAGGRGHRVVLPRHGLLQPRPPVEQGAGARVPRPQAVQLLDFFSFFFAGFSRSGKLYVTSKQTHLSSNHGAENSH